MLDRLTKAFNATSEILRGPAELAALYGWTPWLIAQTPDSPRPGKPVLILPGLSGSDHIMAPLLRLLAAKGYDAHGWDGGINRGFNAATAEHLVNRLRAVHAAGGGQKVVLIGHSLGGLFARELARDFPDMIESVVTLGSPFGMRQEDMPPLLEQAYKFLNPEGDPTELTDTDLQRRRLTPPPGVPMTSIYSKADGLVPWRACLNPPAPLAENIAVPASHLGMPYHPLAVAAILDRLAADPAAWAKFKPARYSPLYSLTDRAHANDLPADPEWKPGRQSRDIFNKKK
jgi:pimeloyl-ACP methyl ester carboxylesterase